jgi:acetoin utilization deacetylase AcuC-like enzyme
MIAVIPAEPAMKTLHTDRHRLHHGTAELIDGTLKPCFEMPARVAIVVSLGVDTFEHDPISAFRLVNDDYLRIGEAIGRLGRRTLFVMEGGYSVEDIGVNAVNVLAGFEAA